jgi:hypothetical protein
MNAQEMAKTYGYIRASTDKQIASPEPQRQIIEDYASGLASRSTGASSTRPLRARRNCMTATRAAN